METQIQPLPLAEEDKTLASLLAMQTLPSWEGKVEHWRGMTTRGTTIHLYFYAGTLEIEVVEGEQHTDFYNYPLAHPLTREQVLHLLGLSMQEVAL